QQHVAPFHADDKEDEGGNQAGFKNVAPGNSEHVPEKYMMQVHASRDGGDQHDPEAEHAGEYDPHDRVLLDAAVARQEAGGHGTEHSGGKGSGGDRDSGEEGKGHSGQ